MKRKFAMNCWLPALGLVMLSASGLCAEEVARPVSERYAATDASETPDFRRHVLPLLGRLGCNGRACHGSFQGQGGFRLSLFGYDFDADHKALQGGDAPRVNLKQPLESLILQKPTLGVDHEGGERMKPDTWQYRLLRRWVETGAAGLSPESAAFVRLEVRPAQLEFKKAGEAGQLAILVHWADGTCEDVTPICRFRSNDESIAEIDETGRVTAVGPGDTHVVAFYDNGVLPVPVLLPVGQQAGDSYPQVPTPTKIDELVVGKLRRLGIVPAELCSDADFLRRASLDVTGTLPTPEEVEAFLADTASDKRSRKIEQLLTRPAYVAWWTTKLCDITGNNAKSLNEAPYDGAQASTDWYQWIYQRVEQNMPYDQIVAGLILATSRPAGQSYDDYCLQMNQRVASKDGSSFAAGASMPHYWMRRTNRKPEDMAQSFAYTFMGVRLQCAQCHKHPFDQWTKQDFDQFSDFFRRVGFGVAPADRKRSQEMREALAAKGEKKVDLKKELGTLVAAGKVIPWPEVFVTPPAKAKAEPKGEKKPGKNAKNNAKDKPKKPVKTPEAALAKLLGAGEVELAKYDDPRQALLDWLRADAERYFARSLVNRVWAAYFSVGIIEPADDLNLANPPSNEPLLAWLTHEFIAHNYDLRWLHREIVSSRTYQLSCQANETNRHDTRNFSRAQPRRLPAEIAYNAILQVTARSGDLVALQNDPTRLVSGPPQPGKQTLMQRAGYALGVFGKPARATNCDCERTQEASLLQTLYLRNDQEMLSLLDRPDGWLQQLSGQKKQREIATRLSEVSTKKEAKEVQRTIWQGQLAQWQQADEADDSGGGKEGGGKKGGERAGAVRNLKKQIDSVGVELKALAKLQAKTAGELKAAGGPAADLPSGTDPSQMDAHQLVREAYLRSLSRLPTEKESARSEQHLASATDLQSGTRDLLWALLNTKEFILNH